MKSILVIDDEAAIVTYVKHALSAKGYNALATTDVVEALDLLRQNPVDLVVLDVMMPKKSGIDLYKEIKVIAENVPVLFLTGNPDAFSLRTKTVIEMVRGDFIEGSTDILYKPFDLSVLLEKVASLLGEAHTEESE